MICPECRIEKHEDCIDLERLKALKKGEIPAVRAGGEWCDCQHGTERGRLNQPGPHTQAGHFGT